MRTFVYIAFQEINIYGGFRNVGDFTKLGCLGVLLCALVASVVVGLLTAAGISLGAIPYMLVTIGSFVVAAWVIISIKNARGENQYLKQRKKNVMVSQEVYERWEKEGIKPDRPTYAYTEEEVQKLPAWKRVELMKEQEKQNKNEE